MITLCFPTLNRYDLLNTAIMSAVQGELSPDVILVVDNGGHIDQLDPEAARHVDKVYTPGKNIGCASSWNWFIRNSDDIRIISNDDVEFHGNTISELVANYDETAVTYPCGAGAANAFSCFVMPNNVVEAVGLFDETISPNYAYFEDNDYYRRMVLAGRELKGIPSCSLNHTPSSTIQRGVHNHDQKFKIAQENYYTKWGGLPHKESFRHPYNDANKDWKYVG